VGQLEITGMVLGGLLTIVFVGYMVLVELRSKHARRQFRGPQKFAGGFSALFGVLMLGAWIYFFIRGQESLMRSFGFLATHVTLELISSLALIVGGVAMFRGLSRAPAIMMTAYAILIFTQVLSLSVHGSAGHLILMDGVALILLIPLLYFVGLVYAWEHFVLKIDQPNSLLDTPDRSAIQKSKRHGSKRDRIHGTHPANLFVQSLTTPIKPQGDFPCNKSTNHALQKNKKPNPAIYVRKAETGASDQL